MYRKANNLAKKGQSCHALCLAFLLIVFIQVPSFAQTHYMFTRIVKSGQNGLTWQLGQPVINNSGDVAFIAAFEDGNVAIFTGKGGELTRIKSDPEGKLVHSINDLGKVLYRTITVFAADASSSHEVISLDEMSSGNLWPDMNNDATDTVAWNGRQGSVFGIFRKSVGLSPQLIANGEQFSELSSSTSINDQGVVAFGARSLIDQSVFLVAKGDGGPIQPLAETSNMVFSPQINNNGKVAFAERVTNPAGFPDTMGIYIHDGTRLNRIDTTSVLTGTQIDTVSINDNDQIVYRKPVNGGAGLFTGPDNIVIAPGTEIDGHVISPFDILSIGPNAINNQGQITFWVQFGDGSPPAIYRADPIANHPPVLALIDDMSINEGSQLDFTAFAADPDTGQTLTFSLDSGAPAGASITPAGAFSWTPSEAQGPGNYEEVTIRVTDSGNPALDDSQTFTITVNEVNNAPELTSPGNKSGIVGQPLSFALSASDSDLPANTLIYSISGGLQPGMNLDSNTREFSWTPSTAGEYPITLRVSDNGTPNLFVEAQITLSITGAPGGAIPSEQRLALIDLYNSTNGANWTNKTNWLGATGTECTWFGVTCDATQSAVIRLNLVQNNLNGTIPSSVGNITSLLSINLVSNQLTGSIPSQIGSLTSLRNLDLYLNQLSGAIPAEIGNLSNLQHLGLQFNQLSGPIPPQIGNLTNLISVDLRSNRLTGSIPKELGTLNQLFTLLLSNNRLSGSIPAELSTLGALANLWLNGNQLGGEIPSSLIALTSLGTAGLDLRWNALYSNSTSLVSFLNLKQTGGDWQSTQTVAPTGLSATVQSSSSIFLAWAPISYTSDPGRYAIFKSTTQGGPYSSAGFTPKTSSGLTIIGLDPGTTYYFAIRTETNPHLNNQNFVTSGFGAEISATTLQATTTTLTSSMDISTLGRNVAFTATVTSPGGIPTGSVTFRDEATVLGTIALDSFGQAGYATSTLSVGLHRITATYTGNATYASSTSAPPLGQTVNPATPKIDLRSFPNKAVAGQPLTLQASVTSNLPSPTGTVTFRSGATVLGTATLSTSGVATFTTGPLAVGDYTFTATYNGDVNFTPVESKPEKVTVK